MRAQIGFIDLGLIAHTMVAYPLGAGYHVTVVDNRDRRCIEGLFNDRLHARLMASRALAIDFTTLTSG